MNRRSILAGLAVAAWLLMTGGEARAQFAVTITFDENGHGTFTNTTGFNSTLLFALQPDPGPGGLAGALTYDLQNPPGLVAGDLIMLEPGGGGAISDIIRFNPNEVGAGGGTGALVFYSDNVDGKDSLADIGFPTALYANNLTVTEVGPEGNNGFTYTPTAGQPGFVAGAGGPVTYVIKSDVLPEPSSIALGGIGAVALLVGRTIRRRRAARAAA